MQAYGFELLEGAIDCHVHVCPHINARSISVFDAVREAASANMRAIVLMDNFQNSSGYAALANRELSSLGVEVLGGIILQPGAGGVSLEAARTAIAYGYGEKTGARFISMPTHHTRHVGRIEGRNETYLANAFHVPDDGDLPRELCEIISLCAQNDVVFDCGHVSGSECVSLVAAALRLGVKKIRTHCTDYSEADIAQIAEMGGYCEFSYFALSPATQVGLTHADSEKHRIPGAKLAEQAQKIRAAGQRAIVSSDSGISLLAPPVETLRQYMLLLQSEGFDTTALRRMTRTNPAALFSISLES